MNRIKEIVRQWSVKNSRIRNLRALYLLLTGKAKPLGLSHIYSYQEEQAIGPLQREEALFLFALLRVVRPKLVVEFGFLRGDSALNFLAAIAPEGRLLSYDISDEAEHYAKLYFSDYGHFKFLKKSQTEFSPQDLDSQLVDFVFLDAAHDLELNQRTWQLLHPHLSEEAIVAIHDTGTWSRKHLGPLQNRHIAKENCTWISETELAHQPDERKFVNWIREKHPSFSTVNLHTGNTLRHGLTLIQKSRYLDV